MSTSYYTILIKDDHSFAHTNKKRIMYRSTGIDKIRFLVNPMYNDLDMTKVNTVLEYVTPISRTYRVIVLTPSTELYSGKVEYLLPIDLQLTSEVGELEFTVNFSYLSMNDDGTFKEQVRPIGYTSIKIEDTVHWSDYIANSNLDNIAQIMMTNQSLVEELKVQAELLNSSKADNIVKDQNTNEIYLTAQGIEIGNRIKDTCDEDGVPVIDLNGSSNSGTTSDDNDVIEF